jgi:hypothetical protein
VIRRCVPENEFQSMLAFSHDYACGGHFGPRRTARKILDSGLYWESLFKDAYKFYKNCERCQRVGALTRKKEIPQVAILICEIFDVWGINIMGPLPSSCDFLIFSWLLIMYRNGWKLKPPKLMTLKLL